MEAKEFAREWRLRLEALRANRPREVLTIAQELTALVKLRIQTSGQDFEESPFPPYVPGYAKRRARLGFQTEYVDFTRSGRLWANVRPEIVNNTADSTTVEVTARDSENQDKLRGAVRKRGNILRPSRKEIDVAAAANRERIRKYLGI